MRVRERKPAKLSAAWVAPNGSTVEAKATNAATAVLVEQQRRRHAAVAPHMSRAALAGEAALAEVRALGETLVAHRRAHGYTAQTLASLFGVSRATVARTLRMTTPARFAGMTARVAGNMRVRLLAWLDMLDALEQHATADAMRQAAPSLPSSQMGVRRVAPTPDKPIPQHTLATYRVLILENDPDIIDIYRLALAEAAYDPSYAVHYEPQVVATLDECLASLEAAQRTGAPFDALIMDLSLRDLQRQAVRANNSPADVVDAAIMREGGARRLLDSLLDAEALLPRGRLVVSGMAPYHLRQISGPLARLGMAYLPKPFDIETLLAGVYSLCAPNERSAAPLSFFLPPTE